jgi:uncharacterized LabA/DUF88 family protein
MGEIKSALFVDFDNIYIELNKTEEVAARNFASNPLFWLKWLSSNIDGKEGVDRRFLVRSCYLNPAQFHRYRTYFTRAGFLVVDCPQLTASYKNGADIRMVMDILDALSHPTHFDEFVIMSGDSDFTPVLYRLREHNRRTVILTPGQAAVAYRNAADHVIIGADEFVDALLKSEKELSTEETTIERTVYSQRIVRGNGGSRAGDSDETRLNDMTQRLQKAAELYGEIPFEEIARRIMKGYYDVERNWFGFGTLRNLVNDLVHRSNNIEIIGRKQPDGFIKSYVVPKATQENGRERSGNISERSVYLAEFIADYLKGSDTPVPMASMAQLIQSKFTDCLETEWYGYGTFKRFIEHCVPSVKFDPRNSGILYLPEEHELTDEEIPSIRESEHFAHCSPEMAEFMRRANQITNAPMIAPPYMYRLFDMIHENVGEEGFHMTQLTKKLRDCSMEEGFFIPRSAANFIVQGLFHGGIDLREGAPDPNELRRAFRENLISLFAQNGYKLDEQEQRLLEEWIASDGVSSTEDPSSTEEHEAEAAPEAFFAAEVGSAEDPNSTEEHEAAVAPVVCPDDADDNADAGKD